MAIFFLMIGLELERELYNGRLSHFRDALLPIIAAVDGICVPALLHLSLDAGSLTQGGMGIPMATDIAFALGVLALLGSRVPASLKIFLTALAVIDDLGAIAVIALFYTQGLSIGYLGGAVAVFGALVCMNRFARIMAFTPNLSGGALMWILMLKSGIHATIAGVLLAFAISYSPRQDDKKSPSHQLEHMLHIPTAFVILPCLPWPTPASLSRPAGPRNWCLRIASGFSQACWSESPSASSCSCSCSVLPLYRSEHANCHPIWRGAMFSVQDYSAASALPCRSLSPIWHSPGKGMTLQRRKSPFSWHRSRPG